MKQLQHYNIIDLSNTERDEPFSVVSIKKLRQHHTAHAQVPYITYYNNYYVNDYHRYLN
jgi:hypothetical protein